MENNNFSFDKKYLNEIKEYVNLILFNMKGIGIDELRFVNAVFKEVENI